MTTIRFTKTVFTLALGKYIRTEWMPKIALWCRGIVFLIEIVKDMTIQDNNQGSEGVISNEKTRKKVQDHTEELGKYAMNRYYDIRQNEKMFAMASRRLGLRMDETFERRTAKAAREKETTNETAETRETEREHTEQIWSKRSSDKATREAELRADLKRAFNGKGFTAVTNMHKDVVKVVGELAGTATIKAPSYVTLGHFMAKTSKAKGGLNNAFYAALEIYVSKVSASATDDTNVAFDLEDPNTTAEV
jgi:hypothetical protein